MTSGKMSTSAILTVGFLCWRQEHGGWYSTSDINTDFFSQELRLLSPDHEKYEYLVGLYYADAETKQDFFRNATVASRIFKHQVETESFSVFWPVSSGASARATSANFGLRWLNEQISAGSINYPDTVPEKQSG